VDPEQNEIPTSEIEVSERQARWQQVEAQVNEYRDGLGKRVDAGIKPAVIALNALGFETSGSCEGHLERGDAAPWVDVTVDGTDQKFRDTFQAFELADQAQEKNLPELTQNALYKRAHSLSREASEPIIREAAKMLPFLEEFYTHREVAYAQRITLHIAGSRFRLQSQGVEIQSVLPKEEKQTRLEAYRQEMSDFSQFLKDRYFKQ
jgi:hypothetical protein